MRVGLGQYERSYSKNSSYYLGGILISEGSDSSAVDQTDILIFCIADALLGAIAQGGIYQSVSMLDQLNRKPNELLKQIEKDIHYRKYKISNIDITISTSFSNLENKITNIHSNLISWLYLKPEQLNLKISPIIKTKPDQVNQIKIISAALIENR